MRPRCSRLLETIASRSAPASASSPSNDAPVNVRWDLSINDLIWAVFVDRDEADPRVWVVDRVDLSSGARTRLATGHRHLANA